LAIGGGALVPLSLPAQAQGTAHRIGLLSPGSRTDAEVTVNLLRLELNKLGWTDGRNIVLLEPRIAEAGTNACRRWRQNSSPRIPT